MSSNRADPPATASTEVASIVRDPDLDQRPAEHRGVSRPQRPSRASRKSDRKRVAHQSGCEREDPAAEPEFMQAMQRYKQCSRRMFPTWSEILEVLHGLGYEKAAEPDSLPCALTGAGEPTTAVHVERYSTEDRFSFPTNLTPPERIAGGFDAGNHDHQTTSQFDSQRTDQGVGPGAERP